MSAVKSTGPQGLGWRMWGQGRVFSCYTERMPGGKCLSLFSSAIKLTKAGTAQRTEVHLGHHCTAGGWLASSVWPLVVRTIQQMVSRCQEHVWKRSHG